MKRNIEKVLNQIARNKIDSARDVLCYLLFYKKIELTWIYKILYKHYGIKESMAESTIEKILPCKIGINNYIH